MTEIYKQAISEATDPKISRRSETSSSDGASRICLHKKISSV
jgi:hypothetical protein